MAYNYPETVRTEYPVGKITVVNGLHELNPTRLKEIVTDAHFDGTVLTPNGDGNQDNITGSVTLTEPAQVTVWIVNKLGKHVNNPIAYQNLSAGVHPFTWDGKDAWGGTAPNGTYSLKVSISKDNDLGELLYPEQQVTVKESFEFKIPDQPQRIRVISRAADMTVNLGQGHKVSQGDIFTVLNFETSSFRYHVLITDNIDGWINVQDVEFIDLDLIPEKWVQTSKDNVRAYAAPSNVYEIVEQIPANTRVRILSEEHTYYRVLLPSGKQGYISTQDVAVGTAPQPAGPGATYTVQAGDTMYLIAKKLGVALDALTKANPQAKPENIYPGLVLNVPAAAPQPAGPAATYTVQAGDTMYLIAKKLGVGLDALVKANPQAKPENIYPGLVLNVPAATPQPAGPATTYTVQAGDTMYLIAKKLGVGLDALTKANPQAKPENIYPGLVLNVPVTAPQPAGPAATYTVQAGDTMYLIAKKLGVGLDALVKANPQAKPENIYSGLVLNVPAAAPQPAGPAATYTVQIGDTMYLIAKKLGVALDALIKANTQAKPENIYPGLVLNVPAEASQPAQSPQPSQTEQIAGILTNSASVMAAAESTKCV